MKSLQWLTHKGNNVWFGQNRHFLAISGYFWDWKCYKMVGNIFFIFNLIENYWFCKLYEWKIYQNAYFDRSKILWNAITLSDGDADFNEAHHSNWLLMPFPKTYNTPIGHLTWTLYTIWEHSAFLEFTWTI